MNKIKTVGTTLLLLISVFNSIATTNPDSSYVAPKHIIKGRMVYPILDLILIKQNVNMLLGFSYERVIAKKRSICVVVDGGRTYSQSYINNGILSQSNGITIYPEYRFYPFNPKKIYPRGFFVSPSFNIGFYQGWNRHYNSTTTTSYNNSTITITNTTDYVNGLTYSSNFTSLSFGLGAVFGWQFLMGKHKRFSFSFMAGLYVNKNYTIDESFPIFDDFRMYPENSISQQSYVATLLGYSFGAKTKKQ